MLVLRSLCVCLGVEVCKEAELHVDIRVSMYSYKISWNSTGGTDRLTWAHEARGGGAGSQRPGGLERIRSSLSRSEIKTRDGLRAHNRPGQSPLGWPSLQGGWSRHARHYVCPGPSHTGRCCQLTHTQVPLRGAEKGHDVIPELTRRRGLTHPQLEPVA